MTSPRKRRALVAGSVLAALALGCILILLIRPECLILKYTGFYCVGCGTQRMVLSLLRGDFAGAFRQNPFMFVVLPAVAVYILLEAWRYTMGKRPLWWGRWSRPAALALLALAAVFTVARNIPGSVLVPV